MNSFTKNFSTNSGVVLAALVCLACTFASMTLSQDRPRSWVVLLFTIVCFSIAGQFMVTHYAPDPARVLHWLFISTLPLLAFHLVMTLGRTDGRIWSPTALANLMAALLMPALALRRLRWSLYALGVVLVVGSRGGWLNVAAGLFTLAILQNSISEFIKRLWPVGFIAIPMMAVQVLRPFERVSMWETAIAMFKAAPVLGMGPGTFGNFHPVYPDAHNLVLNIAAEMGLLGVLAFSVLAFTLGRALWQRRAQPFARGVMASLVGMLASGLIGVPTYEIAVSAALAVLIGVSLHD